LITKVVSPKGKEVLIGAGLPTVVVGERINPFGKGAIKEGIVSGNMEPIRQAAVEQVEAGADVLILSVGAFGVDEATVLPQVTAAVMEAVDVPLCLEGRNPVALEKALQLGCGTPIISSVTGEAAHLDALLPLVRKYNTALVALASDASGIPKEATGRMEIIRRIAVRAQEAGVGPEKLIVDCVTESSAVSDRAVAVTLETMKMVIRELGLNLILGASNVSFGLPSRVIINALFLGLAIHAGLNCAISNPATMKQYIMAADLLVGRDARARRYTTYYRKMKSKTPV
jgi:5-methyltetrahydrofolate--homocysteine methyltransferase